MDNTLSNLAEIAVEAVITGSPAITKEDRAKFEAEEPPQSIAVSILASIAVLILFIGFIVLAFAV